MEHTHFLAAAILPRATQDAHTPEQIDAFYEANGCEVWTWLLRLPNRLRMMFTKHRETQEPQRSFAKTAAAR